LPVTWACITRAALEPPEEAPLPELGQLLKGFRADLAQRQ
jgi:hypothetical protein